MTKKLYGVIFSVLFYLAEIAMAQEPKIEALKAPFYVDRTVVACGDLAQIKPFSKGYYLNLDHSFPRQTLTLLIWEENYPEFTKRFGTFEKLIGQRFCARGKIESYRDLLQITLRNPQFLRLMQN